jgi:xylitol oxidase
MKRKSFLRLTSTLAVTPMIAPLQSLMPKEKLKNWAGNLTYSTDNISAPSTVETVSDLIKKTPRLKALGTRHCFNTIADSRHQFISSQQLNKVISLDEAAQTVTVGAGIKYGELAPLLHEKGFALHNLASLPHISVAGSCVTATHGSGVNNGNLATAIKAFEFVAADGTVHQLSAEKDGDLFRGAVVNLGAIGVMTKVALQLQKAFNMRQYVYEHLPVSELKENFDKIMSAGYSVSLFTDWQSDTINEVWIKSHENESTDFSKMDSFFGAKAAVKNMHPIADLSAENCTDQMGVPGPWYERLPHFKMGFTPSSGKELQAEYFVPYENAVDAILAIAQLGKKTGPHLFISELRSIAADDLWMSPCYNRKSVAIHFTWKQEWNDVQRLLPLVEKELSSFDCRPHWGKLFRLTPAQFSSRYERLNDFKSLVAKYDPAGKFKNDFLKNTILG